MSGPRQFEIVDRARPVAGDGKMSVKIMAAAVCRSDLDIYTSINMAKLLIRHVQEAGAADRK